jgi:hypothetical protein
MSGADALLLSVAPGAHWHLTAKVFEYLGSGRPILAVVPPGDCRDLLEHCGGATLVDPAEPERITELLAMAIDTRTLPVDRPRNQGAVDVLEAQEVARELATRLEVLTREKIPDA